MIPTGRHVRVYAATKPTDLRKSYDTLAQVVKDELGHDPTSGALFLFVNAERRRAKLLFWDGTGLCIFMKRLEGSKFAAPWKRASEGIITMTASELALFIEGSQLVFIGALSPDQVQPGPVITHPLTTR